MQTALGFIHEFIPGTSPRTLLLLHGTGGDEKNLIGLGQALDPAANLLSPRGKVLEQGHTRFFRRYAEGVFDLEDLRVRTDELAQFVEDAAAHYRLDPAKIIAVAYSNGATICASLLLRHPQLLRRATLFRAMPPFLPEELPDLRSIAVWISAGKEDVIIPPAETEKLATLLRECGAEVTLEYVEADHSPTMADITSARAWLVQQTS